VRFILTGGQVSDYKEALRLIEGFKAGAVFADKGYDADYLVDAIEKMGGEAVIPSKKNRIQERSYDKNLYKERNMVERLFNRLKNWRRIATRYDKTASAYMGFLTLAGICLWLK
jgi:transposase